MNRIDKKFSVLKKDKKKAFIVYLSVGYPNIKTCERLILELSKLDVDMFELGMPFSDPLADGPMIQESSSYALKHKINIDSLFSLARRLRKKIDKPLLMMGYFNPILQYGLKRFAVNAKKSTLDGVIIPDLPIEEAAQINRYLNENKIHLINFIAPTTDLSRIKKISVKSKGFIYYVSLTGVTGARHRLPAELSSRIRYLKRFFRIPVCVGFGISKKQHFQYISGFSDGVIVGSAIIKKIKENLGKKDLVGKVTNFVRNLIH